jgi:hypothetical protein
MGDAGKVFVAIADGALVWKVTHILPLGFVAGFAFGTYLLSRK